MISVIGLGGGGSNIADEFAKQGFLAGTINFSQKDIESLEHIKYKHRLNGSEGVGHDRQKAIQLFTEQHQNTINFILDNFSDQSNEMIIFPFACGGGSGSGLAPILIDIISNTLEDKVIVAMPILPDFSESAVSQMNTLQVFEELSSLDVCVLPVDNEQIKSKFRLDNKSKLFKHGNQYVVELFTKLFDYTNNSSKNGNFDKRDFLTVFNVKGIATIGMCDITKLNQEELLLNKNGVSKQIQDSWIKSVFAPINTYRVLKSAIIFDAQERLLEYIDTNHIYSKFECGIPLDIFNGVYQDQLGNVMTVLTGLSWCNARLKQIEEVVEIKQSQIEKAMSVQQEYKPKSFNLSLKNPKQNKKSVQDIFKKYKS